jgi:hypothetical protein
VEIVVTIYMASPSKTKSNKPISLQTIALVVHTAHTSAIVGSILMTWVYAPIRSNRTNLNADLETINGEGVVTIHKKN